MTDLADRILALAHLPSTEIGPLLGCSSRYARRILQRHGLAHPVGAPEGDRNPSWRGGRSVDLDGYILLGSHDRRLTEHRLVMAQTLGRDLLPDEVVDHIDGITIHNAPENLRLFATNGEHLATTATGPRQWSVSGRQNTTTALAGGALTQLVDTYRLRKERGDVRLRAILRAALELGTEHPCLLGTTHWLTQIGIDPKSRPSLERGFRELSRRYAEDLLR